MHFRTNNIINDVISMNSAHETSSIGDLSIELGVTEIESGVLLLEPLKH